MLGCRPAATPIEQNCRLSKDVGTPVDKEFMHDPRSSHMDAAYHILRYLKSSPGRGLLYTKQGNLQVECYTDVDWAGSLDDRRSTSGYCTFVGGNLVAWRSKKQVL
jgi:hypothetical protein